MTDRHGLRRLLGIALLAGIAAANASCLGCRGAPDPGPSSLRARFSERAARVLDGESAFVGVEAGFAVEGDRAFRLTLPRAGGEPARFDLGGFSIRATESGALGDGVIASSAVAYPREGGASYWAATPNGYEEWLHLDEGVAVGGAPVATWDIEGATLREIQGVIAILGEDGVARIEVTAPEAWTEDGRPVTPTLTARGSTIELWVDAGGDAVLVDPAWIAAGTMLGARASHGQVLLQNGKVLAVGGASGAVALKTAETYDPGFNLWFSAAPMTQARAIHTATLLQSGKVLVTGGTDGMAALATTEIYDPTTNTWAAGASMSVKRAQHTATLLQNGTVLVTGGYDATVHASAEIYDPATNTWTPTGPLAAARYGHTATLLQNGKVLVAAGGDFANYFATAEIYDPVAKTWSAAGTVTGGARDRHTAVLLQNGKVLVAGGTNAANLNTASLFDPTTNGWTAAASMTGARRSHAAALLPSGQVLEIGGFAASALATVQQYDPLANTWSTPPSMAAARYTHGATLLQNGIVLAVGGLSAPATAIASVERYTTGSGAIGTSCVNAASCLSGFCVDGVCCNNACNAGACDACSLALGASANGTCTLLTGNACNDGNACTQTDTCSNGACLGSNPVVCTPLDQCHAAGTCSPATGVCSTPAKPDGALCDDGDACTQLDLCAGGACAGGDPVVCAALDQCHSAGTCDSQTGICDDPAKPDGDPCDDGDACTLSDTCLSGSCAAGTPVVCAALDQCHSAGTCDSQTGICDDPVKPDGDPCDDGDACTQSDTCQTGACAGSDPVVCAALDQCHSAGACDPQTGTCDDPVKPDGDPCDDGDACTQSDTCQTGTCTGADPTKCEAADDCHSAGACDPETGACDSPAVPDGTPCSTGKCADGACVPDGSGGSGGAGGDAGGTTTGTGAETTAGTGGTLITSAGCGCTTSDSPPSSAPIWLLAALSLLANRRRRNPTQ